MRYEITLADPLDFLQPEHMQTFSEQLAQILPGRDLYSWNYSAGQDKVVVNGCPDKQDDLATLGTVVVTRSYIGTDLAQVAGGSVPGETSGSKVIVSTIEPASSEDGDIWIEDSVVPGKIVFAERQPVAPQDSDVWIRFSRFPNVMETDWIIDDVASMRLGLVHTLKSRDGQWHGCNAYVRSGDIWEQFSRLSDEMIFGASWSKIANPALTRTDDAVGLIANAGVDDQVVQNDFDLLPIFGEIHDVTDDLGNVFVRIPKLYIRKTDTDDVKSWQVSKVKHSDEWYLPWCFWDFASETELPYVDIGKYDASLGEGNKLASKSGVAPLVNKTIVVCRTYARNNNADGRKGYQLLDIHAIDVLRTLFFIEFATLNSQSVMYGYANDNSAAVTSGLTDNVVASSGSPNSNTDGKNPCKYRGIENPWGNVWQWVDGVNINEYQAWVCKNADQYSSNVFAAPYEKLSYINCSSDVWMKTMGYDSAHPFAEFPVAGGGSGSTYYCDLYYKNPGQHVARVGGYWAFGSYAGLSSWALHNSSGYAYVSVGGRLLKRSL